MWKLVLRPCNSQKEYISGFSLQCSASRSSLYFTFEGRLFIYACHRTTACTEDDRFIVTLTQTYCLRDNPPAAYTHRELDNDNVTKGLPFDPIKRCIFWGEKQMSLDQATYLLRFSWFYIGRVLEGPFLTTEKNMKDYIFFVPTPPPPLLY